MKEKFQKGGVLKVLLIGLAFLTVLVPGGPLRAPANVCAEGQNIREQIEEINQEVENKKNRAEKLGSKIEHYRDLVASKRLEQASLEDQIKLLENQIAKAEVSIDIAEQEIGSLELQVERLNGRIEDAESQVRYERELLASLARKLHRQQGNRSMLQMLLVNDNFGDFFNEIYAVASLQRKMNDSLSHIKELKTELAGERLARQKKLSSVNERRGDLKEARRELDEEISFRESLLKETRSSELEYRYMLAELKREQNEADAEIAYLENMLRDKIDLSDRFQEKATVLSWPIEPTRGVSAIFHDPEYPFRHIFEHPGIDIRAYQGTPIRAAAGGIVARAKNAGMGYSYIMLLHNNGISTVYGHVSKMAVQEDTYIERGEVIGYSGGMPGTPGAGRLTTGPHLHFETRLKGIPVNPTQYLIDY